MKIPTPTLLRAAFLTAVCGSLASSAFATDGYFVQGFGAVNASLGGAATAGNDQDLIGSIYKNPANGVLFADRTGSIVFGDIIPSVQINSSVAALGLKGSSNSTINGVPYMSLMASWKSSNPNLAWFAGAVSEAGLSFHAATSATNPVFMPQAGAAGNPLAIYGFGGFGDVRSNLYIVRVPVGLAGSSPDGWSWGVALAPSIGRNLFTPAAFAAPGIAANHLPVYGIVQQQDIQLGLGAQGGLRFQMDKDLSMGISLSSPTWFHTYSWTITDPSGAGRTIKFMMDRPLTAQAGLDYALTPSTRFLADLGYIAYGSTHGFEHSGFRADGSIMGLGWKDSYTLELGVQQVLTSDIVVRVGYNYCSDPIPASMTFYNVGSPLHIENHVSAGTSVSLTPGTTLDISYTYGFSHSQSSTWFNPAGAVAGTNLTSKISGNEIAVGTTFKF
jgi:long-subunit fatty acid transport protein